MPLNAVLDSEQPSFPRASKSVAAKKTMISVVFFALIALAVTLPLLFAGVIETTEAEVRLTSAESIDGWRVAHPECEWVPAQGDDSGAGVYGTVTCRHSNDTRPLTLQGIEAFPGEQIGSGISISSEIDFDSVRAPAWWAQGLMLLMLLGVTFAALALSGWSWSQEKQRLR